MAILQRSKGCYHFHVRERCEGGDTLVYYARPERAISRKSMSPTTRRVREGHISCPEFIFFKVFFRLGTLRSHHRRRPAHYLMNSKSLLLPVLLISSSLWIISNGNAFCAHFENAESCKEETGWYQAPRRREPPSELLLSSPAPQISPTTV